MEGYDILKETDKLGEELRGLLSDEHFKIVIKHMDEERKEREKKEQERKKRKEKCKKRKICCDINQEVL